MPFLNKIVTKNVKLQKAVNKGIQAGLANVVIVATAPEEQTKIVENVIGNAKLLDSYLDDAIKFQAHLLALKSKIKEKDPRAYDLMANDNTPVIEDFFKSGIHKDVNGRDITSLSAKNVHHFIESSLERVNRVINQIRSREEENNNYDDPILLQYLAMEQNDFKAAMTRLMTGGALHNLENTKAQQNKIIAALDDDKVLNKWMKNSPLIAELPKREDSPTAISAAIGYQRALKLAEEARHKAQQPSKESPKDSPKKKA